MNPKKYRHRLEHLLADSLTAQTANYSLTTLPSTAAQPEMAMSDTAPAPLDSAPSAEELDSPMEHTPTPTDNPTAPTEDTAPPSPSGPPPRLAIKSLRLENFKSYGGVVEVGPFHKCFSSIVGPNGSGKSNVIDAMLFVFGRRAKQLRHSKVSELLHHSNTHPNVTQATVTVFFHEIVDSGGGDDDYEIVPDSGLVIARTAYKNNTSKYFLNDREVPMSRIIELLKSKGVDLDNNRFLILQGEVEQIAMMKPKGLTPHQEGLLEYLEDIIGSNRHIENIATSASRVEVLNEERSHKLNRVKAAESERDSLQAARDEALDYLDKEREVLTRKIKLYKGDRFRAVVSLREHTEEHKEAKEKVDNFVVSVKEKEELLSALEKDFNETQRKCDVAVKTMNDAKDKYSSFERKDIQLREDIKAMKAKQKKLATAHTRELNRAEESDEKAQQCLLEKGEAEAQVQGIELSLQKAQEKFDKVRDDVKKNTAPIREQLEEKQQELLPFSEAVNERRQQLEVTQSELSLLVDKLEAPSRNLEKAKASLGDMDNNLVELRKGHDVMEGQMQDKKRLLAEQRNAMQNKRSQIRDMSAACSDMRRKVEDVRAAKEFSSTRSKLHNEILRAGRNGRLHGIVGRLGDLASVDSRFSVAVGAAAGSNLDCIVVETAENAQAAIQFLRTENLGRATFVILEKVEYLWQQIDNFARSPGSSDGPRLFDCLTIPNRRNATALYYSLRNTLYATSLEEARRIAFKPRKNRVVTLQGELIESTGAMTGGGRGPSRYRLGSGKGSEGEMDPAEFQDLCRKLEETKRQLQEEEAAVYRFDSTSRDAESEMEQLGVQISRSALEVKSLEERINYMRHSTIPDLQKQASKSKKTAQTPDVKRRRELEALVKSHEASLQKAKAKCEGLEDQISSLQEKIVAAGGKKLQNAKTALEECRTKLSDVQSIVSTAASRAIAAEKAAEKARKASSKAEEDIEKIKADISTAREESESMLNDAEVVLNKFKEAETVHEEWVEKVKTAQGDHTSVKDQLKKLRREEVSLIEAADAMRRRVAQDTHDLQSLTKKQKSLEKKLGRLSLMSIDLPGSNVEGNGDEQDVDGSGDGDEMEVDDEENEEKLAEDQLSSQEKKQLSAEVSVLESQLADLSPNLDSIGEYKTKDGEYRSQVDELDALTKERDTTRRECDTLRKARLDEFMAGFSLITLKLKELYQMITLGGDAELELVDSLDPFSEGILFSVRPPKKSWKNISNLSGGEKTLSSLALVFALHHFKPTPLYFLDEIDAALDYKNVSIVANYIKDRTKNAQFIIISLRNNMFELADRLVGIYKTHNSTKSVTVDPAAFVIPSIQGTQVSAT